MSRNDSVNATPTNSHRIGEQFGMNLPVYFNVVDFDEFFDMAMVRPRVDWVDLPDAMPPTYGDERDLMNDFVGLHFGGGNKRLAGYTELDWPEWDGERNEPWTVLDPMATAGSGIRQLVPDNSVDSIVCVHTLDHLSSRGVQHWLRECERTLKPGGTVSIAVPHHMGTLAHECIEHKTQYGLKTFRNILTDINDSSVDFPEGRQGWTLRVGYNMVLGLEERNLVQITQLLKPRTPVVPAAAQA